MQTQQQTVHQLLNTGNQRYFSIPAYQRRYEWDEQRWHDLWRDIAPHYREGETKKHFVGVMIVNQEGNFAGVSKVELIDGQQRLTTFLVLLAAIRDHVADLEGKTPKYDQDVLTYVRDADGNPTPQKVLEVSETDRQIFNNVIHGGWKTWAQAAHKRAGRDQAMWAYQYFRFCLWVGESSFDQPDAVKVPIAKRAVDQALSPEEFWTQLTSSGKFLAPSKAIDTERLRNAIRQSLLFLTIEIEPHDEPPVVIFDAINGKRTEFSQWDHSRTYLFMRLKERAETVLKEKWKPLESALEEASPKSKSGNYLDQFLYEYLIARGEFAHQGSINIRRGHAHLRQRIMRMNSNLEPTADSIEDFINEDLVPAATCYSTVANPSLTDVFINKNTLTQISTNLKLSKDALFSLAQIRAFTSGPATPLTLRFVEAWHLGRINLANLETALKAIESFLARALLASAELSPFRAKFTKLCGQLADDFTTATLIAKLRADSDHQSDVNLHKLVNENSAPLYLDLLPQQVAAIFRGIERQLAGPAAHLLPYGIKDDEFTIEHIYPQDKDGLPNKSWENDLTAWGKNTPAEHEALVAGLHALGNLALIPKKANSALGALPFSEKRKVYGLKSSTIVIPNLNHLIGVQQTSQWTSTEISSRSKLLLDAAVARWPENLL
jgi:hypothetical protein